jgi:hypothetical protein
VDIKRFLHSKSKLRGVIRFDPSNADGTPRKLYDGSKIDFYDRKHELQLWERREEKL